MIKPILFNTQMVKAILDGTKTQTRRVIKDIPLHAPYFEVCDGQPMASDPYGEWHPLECFSHIHIGDILYVRETWCKGAIEYGEEPDGRNVPYISQCIGDDRIIHKEWAMRNDISMDDVVWRPSIHMPRKAARLFLQVTNIRAERVQDINVAGIRAEGLTSMCSFAGDMEIAIQEWRNLWNSTIHPANMPTCGWEANPWVWVIEFKKCETPEGWPACYDKQRISTYIEKFLSNDAKDVSETNA